MWKRYVSKTSSGKLSDRQGTILAFRMGAPDTHSDLLSRGATDLSHYKEKTVSFDDRLRHQIIKMNVLFEEVSFRKLVDASSTPSPFHHPTPPSALPHNYRSGAV